MEEYHFDNNSDFENDNYTINIYLTRHAPSCANAMEAVGRADIMISKLMNTRGAYAPNSALSNLGVYLANDTKNKINKINKDLYLDYVYSSELLRAIETASILYGDYKNVSILPYIGEKRNCFERNFDNIPINLENTINRFKKTEFSNNIKIDTTAFLDITKSKNIKIVTIPDKNKFFKKIIPYLFKLLLNNHPTKDSLNVAIVSHNHYISDILKMCKNFKTLYKEPYTVPNTGIWKLTFIYNMDSKYIDNISTELFYPSELYDPIEITFNNIQIDMNPNNYKKDKDLPKNLKKAIIKDYIQSVLRCEKEVHTIMIEEYKKNSNKGGYIKNKKTTKARRYGKYLHNDHSHKTKSALKKCNR